MTTAGNSTTDGADVLAAGDKSDDTTSTTNETLHLIVSSKVLSVASPIFKRMFFGDFKEARELAQSQATAQVYTLELPEDDPLATLILCSILHPCAKTDQVPERPDTTTLKDLAVLTDKYQCAQALAYPGRHWLVGDDIKGWVRELSLGPLYLYMSNVGENQLRRQLQQLAHCLLFAYTADFPRQYAIVAATIVKLDNGHMFDEIIEPLHYYFRHNVLDTIHKERRRCCRLIYKAMMEPRSWMLEVTDLTDATKLTAKILDHEKRLANALIWPSNTEISGVLLAQIFTAVTEFRRLGPDRNNLRWSLGGNPTLPPTDRSLLAPLGIACYLVQSDLDAHRDPSRETWSINLCLDCLKTGKKSAANNSCRVTHLKGVVATDTED